VWQYVLINKDIRLVGLMNNTLRLINELKKSLSVEKNMGYKNAAVFGGFSAFAVSSLKKIIAAMENKKGSEVAVSQVSEMITLLSGYVEGGWKEKEKYIEELMKCVYILEDCLHKTIPKNKSSLQFLKNVGPKRIGLLNRLGIETVNDLLYHFPRRYEDRRNLKKFHQLNDRETETVMGTITAFQDIKPRKRLTITKAAIYDGSSTGYAVWFNQPFVKKQIPVGTEVLVTGKVERRYGTVQITVSDFEVFDGEDFEHTGRIVPIYPTTEGLQPRVLRSIIKRAVDDYASLQEEFLPDIIIDKYGLMKSDEALAKVHFPEEKNDIEKARRRLVFEELFLLQLGVALLRSLETRKIGISHKKKGSLTAKLLEGLPFSLTKAQKRVLEEIFKDMENNRCMNRLLQGDVGSGKTVIAAAALAKTVESGYQGAIIAPTEILAGQHYEGLGQLLEPLGIRTALLTGSQGRSDKGEILRDIKEGRIDVVIGTHAVIQDEVEFQRLGLAVIDEQHRFGVRQRAKMQEKGYNPDVLVMTATPIPRTLALTVYGDLDISIIDELPPGRRPVKTYWITEKMKERVYKFIKEQVKEGRQVYYVCPLVEESEKMDISAAVDLAEVLQNTVFPDLQVGLMHGRLKQDAKDIIMRAFNQGTINILVATTVVEVGVNVPNANLIVIENADRFGLAQLHQLRGRVGRGSHQSYCILVSSPSTEEGRARMEIMQKTNDGFIIAEEDLKLRGPGEFFGTRQSGMPDLKIADIIRDVGILQKARNEALQLVEQDPGLNRSDHANLKKKLIEKFQGTGSYIQIS